MSAEECTLSEEKVVIMVQDILRGYKDRLNFGADPEDILEELYKVAFSEIANY